MFDHRRYGVLAGLALAAFAGEEGLGHALLKEVEGLGEAGDRVEDEARLASFPVKAAIAWPESATAGACREADLAEVSAAMFAT